MTIIRAMSIDDYDAVITLLSDTPGVSLRDADSREATARYLNRNPGLSLVALDEGKPGELVGCLMSGHDGRRGYLQHLAVVPAFQRQGVARSLVVQCLSALAQLGIIKSHVDVFTDNELGRAFWASQSWALRSDIVRFSYVVGGNARA